MKKEEVEYEFNPLDFIDESQMLCNQMNGLSLTAKFKKIGVETEEKDEKLCFTVIPTKFAEYLKKCITAKLLETGDIVLYLKKHGYYKPATDLTLGKICMYLMTQCGYCFWSSVNERKVIEAYKRIMNEMVIAFDTDEVINLKNGIYDLKTGKLIPHDPKYLCMGQVDAVYDPKADAQIFIKFLNDICCYDPALVKVILEIIGYCLTKITKAEKMFFLYGGGSNGKSVLVNSLISLVGGHNVAAISLTDLSSTSNKFVLEGLIGKYVNIAAENEFQGKLNTENLKKFVTGDVFDVQRKYKAALQMRFPIKLVQVLNSLPEVADLSYGFWRRVMVIPFNAKFEGADIDINMQEKLESELPGILNLALEALKNLEANDYKFSYCEAVEKETLKYEMAQKPAWQFFTETYEVCEGNRILKTDLYDQYKHWSKVEGKEPVNVQTFWRTLKTEWMNKKIAYSLPKSNGVRYLSGFKEKNDFKTETGGDGSNVVLNMLHA